MTGKRFRFKLDAVRKVRKHETQRAQQKLARATAKRKEQERSLDLARQRLQKSNLYNARTGTTGVLALRRNGMFRQQLQRAFEREVRRLQELVKAEEEARALLVETRREEEAMESLHDKDRDAHRLSQDRRAQAETDENAILGYNGKKRRRTG